MRNLLDKFEHNKGVDASGLNFFEVSGVVSATDRRDIVILRSLAGALELLAGEQFAPAFGYSTNQDDYRWGKLHRIVLRHPLEGPFNIPPAGGGFPSPIAGLEGIPTDGGFHTVDAAHHDLRAEGANEFMYTFE